MLILSPTVRTTPPSTSFRGKVVALIGTTSGRDDALSVPSEFLLRLWPRPQSCAEARRAVRVFCLDHRLAHLVADAELLVSEVVTNAIEHSRTIVTVVAMCLGGELIVTVRDDGAGSRPLVIELDDPMADGGRGMYLVREIAGSWGIKDHHHGKSVWFRLPGRTVRSAST